MAAMGASPFPYPARLHFRPIQQVGRNAIMGDVQGQQGGYGAIRLALPAKGGPIEEQHGGSHAPAHEQHHGVQPITLDIGRNDNQAAALPERGAGRG